MEWIEADWPAPPWVRAVTTTRLGGISRGAFAGLNLGDHVGDDPASVAENRQRLSAGLRLPAEPQWLRQVHGCAVATAQHPGVAGEAVCVADASVARRPGQVCAVLTADCLPILLTDRSGTRIAAVHAGWRGLVNGVIEAAVACLAVPPAFLLAWMGPAIGPESFEVGAEVREQCLALDGLAASAFVPQGPGKWLADLPQLARHRLVRLGCTEVWGGGICTFQDPARFYSYRRDGITGRMASLIWIDPEIWGFRFPPSPVSTYHAAQIQARDEVHLG
jgi:polyphenol oxidase